MLDIAVMRAAVEAVDDPELPYVTIGDLGMVHTITLAGDRVRVTLLPTYTGCPATEQICEDVVAAIAALGARAEVTIALSPRWTTDRITRVGLGKLAAAGIAPPSQSGMPDAAAAIALPVACPRCGSRRTRRLAEFGATACKAPHVCEACREPFESFKPL